MLLFPYKLDVDVQRPPYATTLLALLCVVLYFVQNYSWFVYEKDLQNFCRYELQEPLVHVLDRGQCLDIFSSLDLSNDFSAEFDAIIEQNNFNEVDKQALLEQFKRMKSFVPDTAVEQWWIDPKHPELINMVTASFSHASIGHLFFNVVFFFAFAIAVEHVLGSLGFVAFFLFSSVVVGAVWSVGLFDIQTTMPALGLSGVVMSCIAFCAVIYPHKFTHMFYWVIILAGTFKIPMLVLALIYIAIDISGLVNPPPESNTAYLGHIAGASAGAAVAILVLVLRFLGGLFTRNKLKK
ncbi:Membrane associated serine protease, rhomboid family [Alteromonadaceae bacterium Bs31]|nr:Membrane associated serine protease, rhomboid family [Alteromonadaceae bacterium Bs31]